MKRKLAKLVLLLLLSLWLPAITLAQGSGDDLTWFSVDGGGGYSSASGYTLDGTIGQPDAGVLGGGGYTLVGGFWSGAAAQHRIYLPMVLRS
jgi:hypothetical protein